MNLTSANTTVMLHCEGYDINIDADVSPDFEMVAVTLGFSATAFLSPEQAQTLYEKLGHVLHAIHTKQKSETA